MILYNVTIQIDPAVEEEWIAWMKAEHIPDVMSTGLFSESRFWRLLQIEETSGPTYAAQYITQSMDNYRTYIERYAAVMRKKGIEKWGDQFIAFRSVMEEV